MSQVTKVNRRKEIKAKEELQAQFQLAISKNNKRILSWLDTGKNGKEEPQSSADSYDFSSSNNEFFDLPIVPNGSGLSSVDSSSFKVGSFINSEGDVNNLKTQSSNVGKNGQDSKAMAALKNNLRNKSRKNVEKKFQQRDGPKSFKQTIKKAKEQEAGPKIVKREPEDEEDDGVAALKSRSVKKGGIQLFGKKKGGRPF